MAACNLESAGPVQTRGARFGFGLGSKPLASSDLALADGCPCKKFRTLKARVPPCSKALGQDLEAPQTRIFKLAGLGGPVKTLHMSEC